MKIRKIKNNVLDRLKNATEEITLATFRQNNFTYKINGKELIRIQED